MIEVVSVSFTTYEDGSIWLSYRQNERNYGYELRYPKNILEPVNENKIPIDNLKSKALIYDVLYSDNEMLYIDELFDKGYYDECKQLIEEDCKLYPQIRNHIDYEPYDNDTDTLVIFGGIITEVLFLKE